ncbi:MAG TPA: ester cyclase [Terriglobales bacterium]|nr:ester cyclase [Terriglobales bacterium]
MADTEAIARSYFEKLINVHDLDYIPTLFDPNIQFHDPAIIPGGQVSGHDGVRGFFSSFFRAFPDVQFQIDDLFTQEQKAAIRFTWTATHRFKFLDIDVTDRHVSVPGIDIFHVTDGRISEVRVAFDRAELVEQLIGIRHPL